MPGGPRFLALSLALLLLGCPHRRPASPPPPEAPKAILGLRLLRVIGGTGGGGASFREPSCVRVASDGAVLVSDALNHRIVRLNSSGAVLGSVGRYGEGPDRFSHPRALALRRWREPLMFLPPGAEKLGSEAEVRSSLRPYAGDLALACDATNRLRILSADLRTLVAGLGFAAKDPRPWSADFTPKGDLLVMDQAGWVERRPLPDLEGPALAVGEPTLRFGGPGRFPGRFRDPLQVLSLPDGSILVTDTGHGLLQRFSPEGRFLNMVGEPGHGAGGLIAPCDAALDREGRILVADLMSPLIEVFLSTGPYLYSLDPRPAAGAGTHPTSLAMDRAGRLWLADRYRHRILVMEGPPPPERSAGADL